MSEIAGVLLAGGLARRMGGGDKCLRPLAGETLLARVIGRVAPQVGPLILNANGDRQSASRPTACRWWPTWWRATPGRSPAS